MRLGIAVREITPPFPMPMGGYGARTDVFDDVNDPLTFTAVVLEESGRRALLGAADLCNFPNDETTPALLDRLAGIVQCTPDHIMLNASHTHGGPQNPSRSLYYRRMRDTSSPKRYAQWLCERVTEAAREAADNLIEGTLWYGEGKTGVPMNRRLERNGRVENAPNPAGPVDDRMQVLLLRNAQGDIAAAGMKISCHPVSTGAQHRITADFPGAWRAEFEHAFGPGIVPFFLQGAGADARPCQVAVMNRPDAPEPSASARTAAVAPAWRALKHSELPIIGRQLMRETLDILTSGRLIEIKDLVLRGTTHVVKAPCEKLYTRREQFEEMLKTASGYEKMYAEEGLARLADGRQVPDHVEYRVQTLWLSREFALIGLDVEPLVGLGRRLEAAVAPRQAMLLGYVNGCISYLPDTAELKRGGYETQSYLFQPWTGPLMPGVEEIVAAGVVRNA